MTEPDVTLTDFALALECALFVAILWRCGGSPSRLRTWLLVYFAAACVASLCGGIVHGFVLESESLGNAILWRATLLAIGVNALAAWAIGALLWFSPQATTRIIAFALLIDAAYFATVLLGVNGFVVAIVISLPATLFLLVALVVVHGRDGRRGALLAAAGVVTTLAAALVQQLGVGAHSVYFNHNATAHVVQIVALALIFAGSRQLLHANGDDVERSLHVITS